MEPTQNQLKKSRKIDNDTLELTITPDPIVETYVREDLENAIAQIQAIADEQIQPLQDLLDQMN